MGENKRGRPSKFDERFSQIARVLCELGATNEKLAEAFDINVDTVKNWRKAHPEFFTALKEGKEVSDDNVVASLYQNALGCLSHEIENKETGSVTRFYHKPNVIAQIFWLKNRKPEEWRDRQEIHLTDKKVEDYYKSRNGDSTEMLGEIKERK